MQGKHMSGGTAPTRVTMARRLRGATTVEFALVAAPLFLAGLTAIEAGHWFMARQVVRLSLHEAARSGATQHAHPDAIRAAFEQALSPLYVPAGAYATPQARMRASHERLWRATGQQAWQIEIVGPSASAYDDFALPSRQHGARPTISNDYLAEQHARARWPQGIGPRSGLTIHQANVLHLRLNYLKRPLTPVMAPLLKAAALFAPAHAKPALSAGLLFMRLDSKMTMQSDPVAWDRPGALTAGPGPVPSVPSPESTVRTDPAAVPWDGATQPGNRTSTAPPPPLGDVSGDDDLALCGVVLCCG